MNRIIPTSLSIRHSSLRTGKTRATMVNGFIFPLCYAFRMYRSICRRVLPLRITQHRWVVAVKLRLTCLWRSKNFKTQWHFILLEKWINRIIVVADAIRTGIFEVPGPREVTRNKHVVTRIITYNLQSRQKFRATTVHLRSESSLFHHCKLNIGKASRWLESDIYLCWVCCVAIGRRCNASQRPMFPRPWSRMTIDSSATNDSFK